MIRIPYPRWAALFCCGLAGALLALTLFAPPARADTGALQASFAAAAQEFGVPPSVLLAVSYNESRWDTHGGQPSTAGGYGPMHLVDLSDARIGNARGAEVVHALVPAGDDPALHTLATAAALLHANADSLKGDARQNIRGGAALLAQYARDTVGSTPADPAEWYGAVARYSGSRESAVARSFADDVYATIRQGASRMTADGQQVTLVPSSVQPDTRTAASLYLRSPGVPSTDCPPILACQFIPAAYEQNNPNDPTDYGNYDIALRPSDGLDIQYIVIHDTEGSYAGTIALFQDPTAYVSANYVLRSSDGQVTQMVENHDVAWHAGNWYVNTHAIGIEHEGYAISGATWYTPRLYKTSARLVSYLAAEYHIPLDRAHIVGHDNVPGPTPSLQTTMHWDPGPFWDWQDYMALAGAPITPQDHGSVMTINPNWATNTPPLTYCNPNCAPLPTQPANFLYLHTAPSENAPLIQDAALPNSGTTRADDWSDKAVMGQQFYRAAMQGDWDGIYFGGQLAWFYNPDHRTNALPGSATLVTPKAALAPIPVYGRAYPEAAAYPPNVPVQPIVALQYSIAAGQVYVAKDLVPGTYYYAPTYTHNPADHTLVVGQTRYYAIFFNHRLAYLKASDVDLLPMP